MFIFRRRLAASCLALLPLTLLAPTAAARPQDAPASEPARFADVGALLDALETAGARLSTLGADVYWSLESPLQGDTTVRKGRFYFAQAPAETDGFRPRTFAAHFNELIVDGRRFTDTYDQRFVFDGAVFTEVRDRADDRYYERRRVARAGERIDPLRLGEGPMPIPIGQSRASIEERFEASLLEPTEGVETLMNDPAHSAVYALGWDGAVQLRLVPRDAHAADTDFTEIRLWYDPLTLLPTMARTVRRQGGDISVLVLYNVARDEPIPAAVMDTTEPPDDEGWVKKISDLRLESAEPDAPTGGGS